MKKIVTLLCAAMLGLSAPISAQAEEIDYTNYYSEEQADVYMSWSFCDRKPTHRVYVYIDKVQFPLILDYEESELYVTADAGLNVRVSPNINSEIEETLAAGTKVIKIAEVEESGWSIINIENNYYFVWDEFLGESYTPPKKPKKVSYSGGNAVSSSEESGSGSSLVGYYNLTAYCACTKCCGPNAKGITASGTTVCEGRTIAMKGLPYGTRVYIEGYGTYTVEDSGNFSSNTIDIYFGSHQAALNFGMKYGVAVYLAQ